MVIQEDRSKRVHKVRPVGSSGWKDMLEFGSYKYTMPNGLQKLGYLCDMRIDCDGDALLAQMNIPEEPKKWDPSLRPVFDAHGLATVVTQNTQTLEVLMVAYATEEALRVTHEKGLATFYTRSRKELWTKGQKESGDFLKMERLLFNEEGTVLYQVTPVGNACHTKARSCFFRQISGRDLMGHGTLKPEDIRPEVEMLVHERFRRSMEAQ